MVEDEGADDDSVDEPSHGADDSEDDLDSEDETAAKSSNRRFLKMMKSASSTPRRAPVTPVKAASQLIKTQLVRKPASEESLLRLVSKQVAPTGSPNSFKFKYVQVKSSEVSTGSKVSINKPGAVNGNVKLDNNAAALKIATAGGPKKSFIATKKVSKPSETPVIIRVRTLDPEQEALRKRKLLEEDKKIGERKVIKVDTQANRMKLLKQNQLKRSAIKDDTDDSMGSEEDDDLEEESDVDDPDAANENSSSWQDNNERLLILCDDAIESLKQRRKAYLSSKDKNKLLDNRTLDKFVRLSDEIASTIKKVIKEDGENLSDADHFEEYCQDVLDSIAFKGDEEDMSQQEAEKILLWLHKKEGESARGAAREPAVTANQLMLYSQILELLTAASTDDGLDKLNSSMRDDLGEDADEEEDMVDEEQAAEEEMEEEEDEEDDFMDTDFDNTYDEWRR